MGTAGGACGLLTTQYTHPCIQFIEILHYDVWYGASWDQTIPLIIHLMHWNRCMMYDKQIVGFGISWYDMVCMVCTDTTVMYSIV